MNNAKTKAKFEVHFTVEAPASSPEQAAAIARDMLLDPDTWLHAEVRAFEYYEPAEDWFPCEGRGVSVYFGDIRSMAYIYGGDVKPLPRQRAAGRKRRLGAGADASPCSPPRNKGPLAGPPSASAPPPGNPLKF